MSKPTYTYRNGAIFFGEVKVIEQWTGDRDGIEAMIRKANAADELAEALSVIAERHILGRSAVLDAEDGDRVARQHEDLREIAGIALASYREGK